MSDVSNRSVLSLLGSNKRDKDPPPEIPEFNCSNCVYMRMVLMAGQIQRSMICVRFPPQVIALSTPQGVSISGFNPPVGAGVTCGEHRGVPPRLA